MDVTFRENEPYYGLPTESGIYLSPPEEKQERGSVYDDGPTFVPVLAPTSGESRISNNTPSQGEDYTAGDNDNGFHEGEEDAMRDSPLPSQDVESTMHGDPGTNSNFYDSAAPINTTGQSDNQPSTSSENFPIAVRKSPRTRNPPRYLKDFVGHKYDITNYISYKYCNPSFQSFIASLDSTSIPHDWKEALEDSKWRDAMLEEMKALEKNKIWELVDLPRGKQPVGCKWVFAIKHTPEGKVERYKARLVAKGYTQTYGIDYEETFAPVAKMNSIRTLISCAANFDWNIYQLDV
jgi:hypothetical protein